MISGENWKSDKYENSYRIANALSLWDLKDIIWSLTLVFSEVTKNRDTFF